eukprot:TRINITY_DN32772_c0_g1_i2.p1 TRINITY_DN32772_c0_g1~~TRINITY_DN32772_c0_g1_i2.p1  ORF type:complete len:349 (-),score=24.16 TRINITY_DN32772_c0_g1_i2:261-1307(-)
MENASGDADAGWLPGADLHPRPAMHADRTTGLPTADENGCVWLKKTMRWRGDFSILRASLQSFPFDVQIVPLSVKSVPFKGHRVRLVDPVQRLTSSDYLEYAHTQRAGKGHFVVKEVSLYDFRIVGVTGGPDHSRSAAKQDIYTVSIFVERPWVSNHVWDLLIMNLLLLLALTSIWGPSTELSLRMSIALTVLLTTAAYNSARPGPIEKWPQATCHDWALQMTMTFVAVVALWDVFATTVCAGQHPDSPEYLIQVTYRFEEAYPGQCGMGWCVARQIDCNALILFLTVWIVAVATMLYRILRTRRAALEELGSEQEEIEEIVKLTKRSWRPTKSTTTTRSSTSNTTCQ